MIGSFLKQMYLYGVRLTEAGAVPSVGTTTYRKYYLQPVESDTLNLTLVTDSPIVGPFEVLKGSSFTKCDDLHGSLKWILGGKDGLPAAKRTEGEAYNTMWSNMTRALTEAKAADILEACLAYRDRVLANYEIVAAAEDKTTYQVAPVGNPEASVQYDQSTPIFLTYKGKVIFKDPRVEAWWSQQAGDLMGFKCPDIITGEECRPARLIPSCPGINAPLVSFDKAAFQMDTLDSGANFPVSMTTAHMWNAGTYHCYQNNSVTFWRGPADDIHRLQVAWWPTEGIDHPFFPLLKQTLSIPPKGTPIGTFWADLEAFEADDSEIQFASWNLSKRRFSLLHHFTVTCRELKQNLLRYRDEWARIKSPPVASLVATEINKCRIVRPDQVELICRAILTGTPYPKTTADALSVKHPNNLITSLWETNTLFREPSMSKYIPIPNVAIPQMDVTGDPPKLEDFLQEAGQMDTNDRTAFYYGVLVALYAAIKGDYHYHVSKSKAVKINDTYLRQPVRTFMGVPMRMLETYRNLLEREGGGVYRIISAYLDFAASQLNPATLQTLRPNQPVTQLGYHRARRYCALLRAYNTQRNAYLAEAGEAPASQPPTSEPS